VICAGIDLGTHSVKLLVARARGRRLETILERVAVTRLGEGLQKTGRLSEAAARRTLRVLASFRRAAEGAGAERLAAVGTLALRRARDAAAFVRRAAEETGLRIRVVDPREEARLAFKAASSLHPGRSLVTLDVGGGSAQISAGRDGRLRRTWSLPLGAVVLTERFLPVHPVRTRDMLRLAGHLGRALSGLGRLRADRLVGIGGSAAVLSRLLPGRLGIPRRALLRLVGELAVLSLSGRVRRGVPRNRADIIVAGGAVIYRVMAVLGAERLLPCPFGLRHGLVAELAGI
jgi:exopolyphosphatase/guanosine-5'-triphosphate,3'-diphosphate pyrophosphatase